MANPTVAVLVTDIVSELGGTPPTDLSPTASRPSHWEGKFVYRKADYQVGDLTPDWDPYIVLIADLKQAINDAGVTKFVDRTLTTVAVSTAAGDATTPYFCVVQRVSSGKLSTIHQFDLTDLTGVIALVGAIAATWTNPAAQTVLPYVGPVTGWQAA